ncbi:MAG TPA: hypothetical protein VFB76_12695 [Candidatus Angelobacter sp.]|nr:hypothetical protein [Candidatus Angelobacter sp.]
MEYYLGEMYENGYGSLPKDGTQAASWYRKAAEYGDPQMQNNVAWSFATSSDPAIRNPAAALEYARKAVNAEKDHPDPNHLDTLAEACYVNQQYDEAVKTEQQALSLASPELVSPENKSEFEKRLEKYQLALQTNKHPLAAK